MSVSPCPKTKQNQFSEEVAEFWHALRLPEKVDALSISFPQAPLRALSQRPAPIKVSHQDYWLGDCHVPGSGCGLCTGVTG